MTKRLIQIGLSAILLSLLVGGCKNNNDQTAKMTEEIENLKKRVQVLETRPPFPQRPMVQPQETAYVLPIGASHVLGNKAAPVTITVFSDYQCPYCSKVDPMLSQVINDPELKDKVNVVMKQFPLSFHPNAKPAAKAALAAGEQGSEKFWAMSEKLFQNQNQLSAENYTKWAKEIGVDVAKFTKAMKDNDAKYEDAIKNDTELGVKTANVRGTPSIYVGGWLLNDRSVDAIKNLIREKKLIATN
jgi:protein-disulfide isomerase